MAAGHVDVAGLDEGATVTSRGVAFENEMRFPFVFLFAVSFVLQFHSLSWLYIAEKSMYFYAAGTLCKKPEILMASSKVCKA